MGRPLITTHDAIEGVAYELFGRDGFEATTIQAIADCCGIGRRTLLRYFPSKNDIVWGAWDDSLERLREILEEFPSDVPVAQVVHEAIIVFNQIDDAALAQHRKRMSLILQTPALQAHSALRYADWRRVIAHYVASRYDLHPDELIPRLAGHVALAMALSAYELWLDVPSASLPELLFTTREALDAVLSGR